MNHSNALKTWKTSFMASQTETMLSLESEYESPGKNFKCPFHSEQSGASMKYYPVTQTMYCFGKCGRSFNVFDLLALQRGIDLDDSAAVYQEVILPLWAESKAKGEAVPVYSVSKPDTTPPPQNPDSTPAREYNPDTPPPVSLARFGKPTAIFRYTQCFYVYRKDTVQADGSRSKDIRPVHWTPQAGWKMGDPAGLFPLYGIDQIRDNTNLPVLVVEGEKAADAARLFVNGEYIVTTWAHGANAVHKTDWKPLFGRHVLIWPDNDEPGKEAAAEIGDMLENAETDCLLFAPTGEKDSGEDAADFLQTCEGNSLNAYDRFKMLHREFQHSCVPEEMNNANE